MDIPNLPKKFFMAQVDPVMKKLQRREFVSRGTSGTLYFQRKGVNLKPNQRVEVYVDVDPKDGIEKSTFLVIKGQKDGRFKACRNGKEEDLRKVNSLKIIANGAVEMLPMKPSHKYLAFKRDDLPQFPDETCWVIPLNKENSISPKDVRLKGIR